MGKTGLFPSFFPFWLEQPPDGKTTCVQKRSLILQQYLVVIRHRNSLGIVLQPEGGVFLKVYPEMAQDLLSGP